MHSSSGQLISWISTFGNDEDFYKRLEAFYVWVFFNLPIWPFISLLKIQSFQKNIWNSILIMNIYYFRYTDRLSSIPPRRNGIKELGGFCRINRRFIRGCGSISKIFERVFVSFPCSWFGIFSTFWIRRFQFGNAGISKTRTTKTIPTRCLSNLTVHESSNLNFLSLSPSCMSCPPLIPIKMSSLKNCFHIFSIFALKFALPTLFSQIVTLGLKFSDLYNIENKIFRHKYSKHSVFAIEWKCWLE